MPRPFPLRPNWRSTYQVTYDYLTEIIVSRSGREQRRAWRQTPRKAIAFLASAITPPRFRALKGFLAATQGQMIYVPEVPRCVKSTGASALFAYTMPLASAPSWIANGKTVILAQDDRVEARTVAGVSGLTVTFVEMNEEAWPAGTQVSPGLPARVGSSLSMSHIVSGKFEGNVEFTVEPGLEVEPYNATPPETWNGREVMLIPGNWADPQDLTFDHETVTVDYDFGRTTSFQPITFGSEVRTADYLAKTRAEVTALVDFFRRMKGMQGECYVPTQEQDMEVASTITIGTASITVVGKQIAQDYADSKVFKAVSVRMTDGRQFYRKVTSIDIVSGNSRVNLAEGLPYTIAPATVEVISWLPLCRLASDQLVVVWHTDAVAELRLSYRTLEDRPAE